MDRDAWRDLLTKVRAKKLTVDAAMERLRAAPTGDLGFATLDLHRALRRGFPEAVYGAGKTADQIVAIVGRLAAAAQDALVTRVSPEVFDTVARIHPRAEYHTLARAIVLRAKRSRPGRPGVVIMTAGTSDLPVAEEAALTAELMGEQVTRVNDVGVAGLHRLLRHEKTMAEARVIVVVAGMEGALPSVVAGLVGCPVVGVPTSQGYGTGAGGYAALLAMLNSCAAGVAVVNIDNGYGAGVLASQINRAGAGRSRRRKA